MTARSDEYAAEHGDPAFAALMDRVDRVVLRRTGLSFLDFADAAWADFFYEGGGESSDEDILEYLADADGLFARWLEAVEVVVVR